MFLYMYNKLCIIGSLLLPLLQKWGIDTSIVPIPIPMPIPATVTSINNKRLKVLFGPWFINDNIQGYKYKRLL